MIWLLTFLLFINLIFIYIANGRRLFSPTIIVNGVFLFSALVMLTNWEFFGYEDISLRCVGIVILSIYSLSLGELITIAAVEKNNAKKTYISSNTLITRNDSDVQLFRVGKVFFWVTCIIAIYVLIARALVVYRFSLTLGNTNGFLGSFYYVRKYLNRGEVLELGRHITYPAVFVKASALYCLLAFCHNRMKARKGSLLLLVPAIIYCMYTAVSTARTGIIEIFFAVFIMLLALYSQNKGSKKTSMRMVMVVAGAIVALIGIFIILGNIRAGDTGSKTSSDLVNYIGAPLIVFNRWLENYEHSPFIGYATVPQLFNLLNKLGIVDFEITYEQMYDVETILASSKSNLKTWLKEPIQDFSIVGMLISRFFIGVIYTSLVHWLTKKSSVTHFGKFIFGCLVFYPLLSAAFADQFDVYIQLETVYMIIIFILIGKATKIWNKKSSKNVIC